MNENHQDSISNYAANNVAEIENIKRLYNSGEITRDEAYERAKPILDAIDERGRAIAKKHKRKYHPLSFASLMR